MSIAAWDSSMAASKDVVIRESRKDDLVHVYGMIKELAVFENLEHQIRLDPATLERDCEAGKFRCLIAEDGDAGVVGYALFYPSYSTFIGASIFLEDLYVRPSCRGRGVGRRLFLAVAKLARDVEGRLDFHVLEWNPAREFYVKLGAVNLSESERWQSFRMDAETLTQLFG